VFYTDLSTTYKFGTKEEFVQYIDYDGAVYTNTGKAEDANKVEYGWFKYTEEDK